MLSQPHPAAGSEPRMPTRPSPSAAFPRTHRRALFRVPGGTTERLLWLVSGDAIGGLGWVGRDGGRAWVRPVCRTVAVGWWWWGGESHGLR